MSRRSTYCNRPNIHSPIRRAFTYAALAVASIIPLNTNAAELTRVMDMSSVTRTGLSADIITGKWDGRLFITFGRYKIAFFQLTREEIQQLGSFTDSASRRAFLIKVLKEARDAYIREKNLSGPAPPASSAVSRPLPAESSESPNPPVSDHARRDEDAASTVIAFAPPSGLHDAPVSARRAPGSASFEDELYDSLRTARTSDNVRTAFSLSGGGPDGDVATDAKAKLTPSERGRLLAFLTPAEQEEFGISSIASDISISPTCFAYKTAGTDDMGFTIGGVVKIPIPKSVIERKQYTRMREIIRTVLVRAVSEEQSKLPKDKQLPRAETDKSVDTVLANIDNSLLEMETAKILEILKKDRIATLTSANWTLSVVYPPGKGRKYSFTVTFKETRGKSHPEISDIVAAKLDHELSTYISGKPERARIVRKIIADLSSVIRSLEANIRALERQLNQPN